MPIDPATTDQLARELRKRFIARMDAKALQWGQGYSPVRADPKNSESALLPWTAGDLRRHLAGEASYGHYLVSKDNTAKLFAFDIDLDKSVTIGEDPDTEKPILKTNPDGSIFSPREVWSGPDSPERRQYVKQLRALGEGLAYRAKRMLDGLLPEGPTMAVAYSGSKGVHVYGWFKEGDASLIRELAISVLGTCVSRKTDTSSVETVFRSVNGNNFWKHAYQYEHLTIEVFPKQGTVAGDGFGNLMRLPLGRNAKGGESFFIDSSAPLDQMLPMDPMEALLKGTLR